MGGNETVRRWVNDTARLCRPDDVVWCDGSDDERERLTQAAVRGGELLALDQQKLPGCYLHRSAPNDVARTEHLTFICSRDRDDAGPTNNWMGPAEGYDRLGKVLDGSMAGRTMYVIPFLMGPPGSPFSRVGVQVTDSRYVVLNMRIMTRMGQVALDHLGDVRRLHARPALDGGPGRRTALHLPLPRRPHDLERGLRLRRQRSPLQEVHGAPDRERRRATRGLARRAHADRRDREPGRRDHLRLRRLPERLRQDESRDAHASGLDEGVEDPHRRRGHRVAPARPGRPAVGGQPRERVLRRGARHQLSHQRQRHRR